MRSLRRWVRNILLRVPVVGEERLVPWIRSWYERLPFLDLRRKRYAQSEARRLLRHLVSDDPRFMVVFDCRITGLAYGDLLHILMVARFLERRGGQVAFVIVDTEPPHFLGDMNRHEIDCFIEDALAIARVVLDSRRSTAIRIPESELEEHLRPTNSCRILFEEHTRTRRPFYRDAFNVFNQLMASATPAEHGAVLFVPNEFREYLPETYENRSYVTWHCRYSTRWDEERLTTDKEFVLGYRTLRDCFPGREIVIISDSEGCSHYSEVAKSLELGSLTFSKSISPSFLGDCALILGSEFFFCYRGGGILEVPFMSSMPFEIIAPVMNETMWDINHVGVWQLMDQVWRAVPRHRPDGELANLVARRVVLSGTDVART